MRRAQRGRRRYRGARRNGIGIVIPVLLTLCIVAAVALYLINDNMSFTLDGAFFRGAQKEKMSEPVETNLIIEPEDNKAKSGRNEPPKDIETRPISTDGTRAVFVPIGSVKNSELFAAAIAGAKAKSGINTLVLEVKAEDGTLAFESDSQIAKDSGLSGDDETLKSAIASAREQGYRVSLYMSCFKDNEAARKNQSYAARTKNKVIWLDAGNVRWLSAYSDSAQEYLLALIEKLSSFAPDEIILSNVSFPAEGKTEIIAFDDSLGTKQEMIKSFIDDAKRATGNITLSAVYENYNSKRRERSGQTPESFKAFENIYINERATSYTLDIESGKKLFENTDCNIITVSNSAKDGDFVIK